MKRGRLIHACYALLVIGVLVSILGFHVVDLGNPAREVAANGAVDSFKIDIRDMAFHLRDKPQKEVNDQIRDWAVYGTLLQMGVGDEVLTRATFETAPVRFPYLEEAFIFDYGRGRRALLDKEVLLFFDHDDRDPTATLGRMADKVRMETGEIPSSFQVFEITPDLGRSEIRVDRRPAVAGTEMFGAAYGYVERPIKDLASFTALLDSIDDVTFAGVKDHVLHLGGRRFPKTRTLGVTVEDVAALLQAHESIAAKKRRIDEAVAAINAEYQAEMQARALSKRFPSRSKLNTGKSFFLGREMSDEEVKAKYQAKISVLDTAPSPDAPGFSLDPQWKRDGLAALLEQIAQDPCATMLKIAQAAESSIRNADKDAQMLAASSAEAGGLTALLSGREVCAEVQRRYASALRQMAAAVRNADQSTAKLDEAMVALWKLRSSAGVKTDSAALLSAVVEFIRGQQQVQCARYDGPLQGTRVGMNLFYTDLLAKLWLGVDHHHAAPTLFIPGFVSHPRLNLDPMWKEESSRLPSTRLWFGPKSESYALDQDKHTIWFEHIAARVFAAGSDPKEPHKEEQPAEASRRALGFWDRHYGDVADYEQQYHLQNQIMKWSLATGLHRGALSFLKVVAVRHDHVFDRWYAQEKSGLRYQYDIQLRPKSDWVTNTECMDLLASHNFHTMGVLAQISGGVSLGGKRSLESAPKLDFRAPLALRRRAGEITGPGTAARALPKLDSSGKVRVQFGSNTRARLPAAELSLSNVDISLSREAHDTTRIAIHSDKGEIGTLVSRRADPARVQFSFQPGGIELGLRTGARARRSTALNRLASARASIELEGWSGVLIPDRAGREVAGIITGERSKLSQSSTLSVGGDPSREARVNVLERADIAKLLDNYAWQRLSVTGEGVAPELPQAVRRSFQNRGPGPGAVRIKLSGFGGLPDGTDAYVESDGSVLIANPSEDDKREAWRDLDRRALLTGADVARLVAKVRMGAEAVARNDLSNPAIERAYEALADGDTRRALGLVAEASQADPKAAREALTALKTRAHAAARFQLEAGNPAEADRLYRGAEEALGALSAREQMRAALAQLEAGQVERGLAQLGDPAKWTDADLASLAEASRGSNAELCEFFEARAGKSRILFDGSPEDLRLVASGVDARSVLRVDRMDVSVVSLEARRRLVSDSPAIIEVYLDDRGFSMNRHDFEASANGTAAELASMPTVQWARVELAGEAYAPGIIESGETRYQHVGTLKPETGVPRSRPIARSAVFIHNCDKDGDGVLSTEERRACGI
ncbi:MAG: hypothetical protein QM820_32490 [Minicystis sp.]